MDRSPLDEADFLRSVSRTFALSIRALPRDLRPAVELAYLLARLADTIADRSSLPAEQRRAHLAQLCARLSGERQAMPSLDAVAASLTGDRTGRAERLLVESVELLLARWQQAEPGDRKAIAAVVTRLSETMQWELDRFGGPPRDALDEAELGRYTDGIAGCVGAFWTELLISHRRLPPETLGAASRLGRRYGRGLQLINIVRDVATDTARGVRFLPLGDRRPRRLRIARRGLIAGLLYCARLPVWQWRVRLASVLPAALGLATLAALGEAQAGEPRKIGRGALLRACALSALTCLVPRGPLLLARIYGASRAQPSRLVTE